MATLNELQNAGFNFYFDLLDELTIKQVTSPAYAVEFADFVARQRERISRVYAIDDLPPVPTVPPVPPVPTQDEQAKD
ncbi:MAG: hypothetical protein LBN42_02795 [Oscillospiraceae bacterium]|jgi:hypothetical protein|nr:hypothetical protein [Oscillospiraceae bacterium]